MKLYAVMQKEILCDESFSSFAKEMTSGVFLDRENAEVHLNRMGNKKDSFGVVHEWEVVELDIKTGIKRINKVWNKEKKWAQ